MPDDVSKKSLKVLDQKLRWLAEDAEFDVTDQLRRRRRHPQPGRRADDRRARARARLLDDRRHHPRRQRPAAAARRAAARDARTASWRWESPRSTSRTTTGSRRTSRTASRTTGTAAPAAAISTSAKTGLVHWCSQQRGHPGIPLDRYGPGRPPARVSRREELRAALHGRLRPPGRAGRRAAAEPRGRAGAVVLRFHSSATDRTCRQRSGSSPWAFVTNPRRDVLRNAVVRVFGAGGRS